MSKRAEEAVLQLFPIQMELVPLPDGDAVEEDVNRWKRKFAKMGYEQAEKDLALTWEDIQAIDNIIVDMAQNTDWPLRGQEIFYEEVLRRFREMKNK